MKTTCKHCGIVSKPHICPYIQRRNNSNRKDKRLYKTQRWQDKRKDTLDKYNGMCLWSFYVDGRVKSANEVHHIVEVLEDETLTFDDDNLVPLEFYTHKRIHKLYKESKEQKENVQKLLRKITEEYRSGDRTIGKYKSYF